MKIVLVAPPPTDAPAQFVHAALERAIRQLCAQQPQHECVVLAGKPLPGPFSFLKKRKYQREIRQLKPGFLIYSSPNNLMAVPGLATAVMITGLMSSLQNKILKKATPYLSAIISDSPVVSEQLGASLQLPGKLLHTIRFVNEDETPPSDPSLIRDKFTSGKDFFLYNGPIGQYTNWERLLQGFSQFKKWQQSGLQLVMTGNIDPAFESIFQEKLSSYKYRHDVVCLNVTEVEKAQLISAAFGLLALGQSFEGRANIVQAFHAGVPVITDEDPVTKELCSDAALYASFGDQASLSRQMILLYKNEDTYNQLAARGKAIGNSFSHQQMLLQLNQLLVTTDH